MKRTTLKESFKTIRNRYLILKAALEVAEDELNMLEESYLKQAGRKEDRIYKIEDEDAFNLHNLKFEELTKAEWKEYLSIKDAKKRLECELIKISLDLVPLPNQQKAALKANAKTNYTVNQKLINLALRLDINTVA